MYMNTENENGELKTKKKENKAKRGALFNAPRLFFPHNQVIKIDLTINNTKIKQPVINAQIAAVR